MTNQIPENSPQNEKSKKPLKIIFGAVFVLFILLVSLGIGFEAGRQRGTIGELEKISLDRAVTINENKGDNSIDFSLFWNVWDLLREKYVDAKDLDANKLFYGAIKGMLNATGDPYTVFLDPEENKKFGEEITGSFEGIGAELGIKNGILTIIAPLKGTPAEKAGLRAGDKILKIGDKNTTDISIDEAVDLIRGPKGTEVRMTIFRNGEEETREVSVKRDVINVKSAELEFKDNFAVIKINRFGQETNREFGAILRETLNKNTKGIILDLRNNPGGYLDSSVDIASKMLPENKVVVIEEDSEGKRKELISGGGDLLSQTETVILINEGSASASEILAGALKDNRENVTIVGKKSFGKGSVQELIPLEQGTAVKITVAKWLTPSGKQINNEGIAPDIEIDLTDDDYENDRDPQIDKAVEILKEKVK